MGEDFQNDSRVVMLGITVVAPCLALMVFSKRKVEGSK
jgi:hypothetical protein